MNVEPETVFVGPSEALRQTVVLPTLDTRFEEKRSSIWCISFQLAWNRLKNDVEMEPIQLSNAQALADRLNDAQESEADVDPGDVLAMSGKYDDGIIGNVRDALGARFPNNTMPEVHEPSDGGVVANADEHVATPGRLLPHPVDEVEFAHGVCGHASVRRHC